MTCQGPTCLLLQMAVVDVSGRPGLRQSFCLSLLGGRDRRVDRLSPRAQRICFSE